MASRLTWVVLALLFALPVAAEGPLAPGDPMPALEGRTLSGRRGVLPEAARGKVALVALGFSYASRIPVEAWARRFRAAYLGDSSITLFEAPMLAGPARMARPFIESGMRRGTPAALHESVITTSGKAGQWKPRVGFRGSDDAYLLLLDPEGRVAWRHAGPPDEEAWAECAAQVDRLRALER